jgi:hypothetical protein
MLRIVCGDCRSLRFGAVSPMPSHVAGRGVPRTRGELAALEARYQPFDPIAAWADVRCDAARWQRHADSLRTAVRRADAASWRDVREAFLRAAALDSTALAELIRPAPDVTNVVLHSALSDRGWASVVEGSRVVIECHRRALVVAADAAETGRPVDEELIARLQDLIVESQETYTVKNPDGSREEVELPRRQYKPVSNYLLHSDGEIEPFAPAALVAKEMRRLTSELSSDAFGRLHPVVQSAYVHVALIRIHPFADGNGRLARTLAAMPLLRAAGLPQLILADQWPAYIQALARCDDGDVRAVVDLFLAAQVNTMGLASGLLETGEDSAHAPLPRGDSAERTLLDLVAVHLREAVGAPGAGRSVAVTGAHNDAVRVAIADADGNSRADFELTVAPDDAPGWLRVASSAGDVLEVWRDDVHPAPTEIAHLRVRSWLDRIFQRGAHGLPESTRVRGLFVLGVPRSGTTMIGNWIGSHPAVLGVAEYGGFYVAHSVAPAYLNRLPGREHESFLSALRDLAERHVSGLARGQGRTWFCDATPWNLHVVGALTESLPDAIFVLMLRHFSGAVLSLRQFPWAGNSWADAAQLWVTLNGCIDRLPAERTIVVGYDTFTSFPVEVVTSLREALGSLGLDADRFDDRQFVASHAHVVGSPRPTVAAVVDEQVVFRAIPSLDAQRWTPEVHAAVWPIVADVHRALRDRFPGVYESPPRPDRVPESEW